MEKYSKLVNKDYRLNKNYRPSNMILIEPKVKGNISANRKIWINKETLKKWNLLVEEAKKENYSFAISSCYRSYSYQEKVLKYYIAKEGITEALKHVAIPGTSEHQTSLAIDYFITRENKNYYDINDTMEEYAWIKNNCYKYGFIIRYPKDKEYITGYIYEPWHLRFVGDIASYLYQNNLTLEEYHKEKIKVKEICR